MTKRVQFRDTRNVHYLDETNEGAESDPDLLSKKSAARAYKWEPRATRSRTSRGGASRNITNLLLTLLVLTVGSARANFDVASLLVWQRSERSVIEADDNIYNTIHFENTCETLSKSLTLSEKQKTQFNLWFHSKFDECISNPIHRYCEISKGTGRKKREIAMATVPSIVFSGRIAYGAIRSHLARTVQIEQSHALNEEELAKLRNKLDKSIAAINKNIQRLHHLEKNLLVNILTITGIATHMMNTKTQLDTFKEMQHNNVSPQLFHLMNISVKTEKKYPYNLMTSYG